MTQYPSTFRTTFPGVAGAALTAFLAGCSGGGSGGGGTIALLESNVRQNEVWQINRTMEFKFSEPIDLGSVNLNTISVTRVGGGPASGSFFLVAPDTVAFQPTCPSESGFTDAGLVPGGIPYVVHVVGSTEGGATVKSLDGDRLDTGLTIDIVTPDSLELPVLFDDAQTGPPTPRIWSGEGTQAGFSYIEEGGDFLQRQYFQTRETPTLVFGAETEDPDYVAPLNLYSVVSSAVAIVIEIDQPVDPSEENISPEAVQLQYCSDPDGDCTNDASGWIDLPHDVELVANCSAAGATLRVTPVGILPQGRIVRVVLSTSFRDLVGNGSLIDITVGSFRVDAAPIDPDTGEPVELGDEFLETFTIGGDLPGSNEDTNALLDAPSALWAEEGQLTAGFNFGGSGGPGGTFDWTISALPGSGTTILNTSYTVITNDQQTATQAVVNGQVDVRNLTINAGGILEIKGPNPCVIRASGNVVIKGKLLIRGSNNRGVVTFNTTNIPEPGATGNGGGGRGGTGNILTTQSTPKGEDGYGFRDVPNGGGGGGETGYNANASLDQRRGAGGGGGSLGLPMVLNLAANVNQCPDQTIVGLDAEDGNPGSHQANGAISGPGQRPRGGLKGPRPFIDGDNTNDFWGTLRVASTNLLVRGELGQPWGGAGGGGGGNCVQSASFPNTNWTPAGDEKGSGGGGGAGSLMILALGDIVLGDATNPFGTTAWGRIDAGGGTGGGGENTSGINRVGAGSGGGSGGHVILQTAKRIDFTAVRTKLANGTNRPERDRGGIWARGGQGGEGKNGAGGTGPDSVETPPPQDRLPADHYTVAQGGVQDPPPCAAAATGNTAGGPANDFGIHGCGGDGGPGIVQLHVQELADIRPPGVGTESLIFCLKPNPVGSTVTSALNNVATPAAWNQLLPIFGRISKAQSEWIPLGSTSVSALDTDDHETAFVFDGLDADGEVEKSGSGATATVAELPSILTGGTQPIADEPATPFISTNGTTIVLDATTVADEIYVNNPALLRNFDLKIVVGAVQSHFQVASAVVVGGLLRVTVAESGTPLDPFRGNESAVVSLHPRFLRVSTQGVKDALPDPVTIQIEFQATTATSTGQPNAAAATEWTSDVAELNAAAENPEFRFFRFRVAFDLGLTELTPDTPVPSIDFLRVPFRF